MKSWFKFLIILLIIINLLGIYFQGEENGRYLRSLSMLFFLGLYWLRFYSGKLLLSVFILLLLCDIFLIYYEDINFKALTYITRITAYLLIVRYLFPHLNKLKLNTFTLLISGFILAINLYLIYIMAESIPEIATCTGFYILFFLFGLSLLILAAAAISFHNRFANKQSFYLVVAGFGLIFSDLFFYIAFYLEFDFFIYLDRISNIVGVAFLLGFCSFEKPLLRIPDIS